MPADPTDALLETMKQQVRSAFAFLHERFGFPRDPEEGPASLAWAGASTRVTAHLDREGPSIDLAPVWPHVDFTGPLGLLILLAERRPDLLDAISQAAAGDQWLAEKTRILAHALEQAGADLLRGDFSAAPSLLERQRQLGQDQQSRARAHEHQRLAEQAREAFRAGRFAEVVDLLSPAANRLGPALQQLLAMAKKRHLPHR